MRMNRSAAAIKKHLRALSDEKIAEHSQRFFKTGPGQYGEGDIFIGIRVPVLRKLSRQHRDLPLSEVAKLLHSKIHEHRLLSLLILVEQYKKSEAKEREQIYRFYMRNMKYVNNWDLVDSSAPYIVGAQLPQGDKSILIKWAKSKNLWTRRIAIIATSYFIRERQYSYTLKIARLLLSDEQDLIHKAVGWMLREVGKRDQKLEREFLNKHLKNMPRTMLRYAIEHFPEKVRKSYLAR